MYNYYLKYPKQLWSSGSLHTGIYVHAQSQREEFWWSWLKGILNICVAFKIIIYPMLQHQPANHKGIQVNA